MTAPDLTRGELRVFAQYDRDVREEADVVVVGSGPGGAVAAHSLACAGRRVVLIEEGPPIPPSEFRQEAGQSMARTMREGGLRMTRGDVVPTMQAIALGGGSLVNSAICVRAPEATLDAWCTASELERSSRADLDPHYDAVEKFLGIAPTPDEVLGRRNSLFRDACDALGYSSEPTPRNVRGCRASGECFTGCRPRVKQSTDITYVPAAIRAGARVLTSVQVQRVTAEGRRATGVQGRVVEPFTGRLTPHRVTVRARHVVLAAGCVATPILLRKSDDLANESGLVGKNLQLHPGVAVMGVFPERVDPQVGATQGYQSLQFIPDGFKLETLWAPPGVLAVRMPGFGHALKQRLAELPYAATWDAITSCNRSLGEVRPRRGTLDPDLYWRLHPADQPVLEHALWILTELFFAAGARKILSGVQGVPDEMHSLAEAEVLRRPLRRGQLMTASTHLFGTTRMHRDPRHGVVDELGRCHSADNLWITDTGVFPRSPSVNPMLTTMALAHRTADALAERI